jgi:hypothetical protein
MIPSTGMILFETSASIFELIWDIALAIFIIRISLVYCTLAFLTSWAFAYIRASPILAINISGSLYFPMYILALALISRFLIKSHEIPRVLSFRLVIGLLGTFFMVFADMVSGLIVYEEGWGGWAWRTSGTDIAEGLVGLAVFGLMPAAWMLSDPTTDKLAAPVNERGHGRKKAVDAV